MFSFQLTIFTKPNLSSPFVLPLLSKAWRNIQGLSGEGTWNDRVNVEDEVRGKTRRGEGRGEGGFRVRSPATTSFIQPGEGKTFSTGWRREKRRGGRERGKERREAASKRGVAVVGERYKCVNRSCYTLGFKWRARPLRFNYGWLTFLTFVRKPRVTLLAARIIFLLIILITRGLKTKTRSRRLNINYGG